MILERSLQRQVAHLVEDLRQQVARDTGLRRSCGGAHRKIFNGHNPVWRFDLSGPEAERLSDFVEEFILDRAFEPAVDEFGLARTSVIDPTCVATNR